MPMNELRYYRHSGRFTMPGLLGGLAVTALVASLVGPVYAYVIIYVPFVYINALICLGYGALAGLAGGSVARRFKVRNATMGTVITLAGASLGFYVSWAVWVYATLRRVDVEVALVEALVNPAALWRTIVEINEVGTWGIGSGSSEAVSGAFLWVVWAAEAVCYLTPAVLVARGILTDAFCERCESWCAQLGGCATAAGDPETLGRRLEAKELGWLSDLGPASESPWWEYKLESCGGDCGRINTLTVEAVTLVTDKKGKQERKSKTLIHRLLLTPEEAQALQTAWAEPAAVAQPA